MKVIGAFVVATVLAIGVCTIVILIVEPVLRRKVISTIKGWTR